MFRLCNCLLLVAAFASTAASSLNYVCPTGGIKDATGIYCCPKDCGQCGGPGCHLYPLKGVPLGDKQCCKSQITRDCRDGKLPCTFKPKGTKRPTAKPTAAPTKNPADGLCANGILATGPRAENDPEGPSYPQTYYDSVRFCKVQVCCPAKCKKCDNSNVCAASTPDECCVHKIAAGIGAVGTDVDASCKSKQPPCVMPVPKDPCAKNPCKNGARCGVEYSTDRTDCTPQAVCLCSEQGNFSGRFCEIDCGSKGGFPCGAGEVGYTSSKSTPNRVCCTAAQDCVRQDGKYGGSSICASKKRPRQCSDCSAKGTKLNLYDDGNVLSCTNAAPYGPVPILTCDCKKGHSGDLCEIKKA